MSKYLYAILLLLGLVPLAALATCHRVENAPAQSVITLPANILVSSKNYSPGEILYDSGYMSGGSVTIKNCAGQYYAGFHYGGSLTNASPVQNDVYQVMNSSGSTVTGIGIRVYTLNQGGPDWDSERAIDNSWQGHDAGAGSDHTLNGSAYRVQLIATGGPITSGTFNVPNPLARVDYREHEDINSGEGDVASQVILSNTQINVYAMGCDASVPSLLFNMGDVDVSAFDNNQTVEGPEQDVSLTCEAGTNVYVTFNGTPASGDNNSNSVFALTDEGTAGVATGVGVSIKLYSNSRQSFTSIPIGQKITYLTTQRTSPSSSTDWSAGNDATNAPVTDHGSAAAFSTGNAPDSTPASILVRFRADYYKTGTFVTPGSANATGTITLQYN